MDLIPQHRLVKTHIAADLKTSQTFWTAADLPSMKITIIAWRAVIGAVRGTVAAFLLIWFARQRTSVDAWGF